MRALKTAVPFALLLLSGCGGGSNNELSPSPKQCTSLSGGGTQVTTTIDQTCMGCTVSDPEKAADGDFDSFATMTIPAGASGTVATRATAQPGVVFPAGNNPGVVVNFLKRSSDSETEFDFSLRTFLQGQQQEEIRFNREIVSECSFCTGEVRLISGPATKQFDAVELAFGRGPLSESSTAQIHEFCSDSSSGS